MASLHLNRDSRDFERNMAKKLSMFRMIVERGDSDLDLPRNLLAKPRRDADGDIDLAQLEEYDALTSLRPGVRHAPVRVGLRPHVLLQAALIEASTNWYRRESIAGTGRRMPSLRRPRRCRQSFQ